MLLSLEEKLRRLETDPTWRTIVLPIEGNNPVKEEVLVETLPSGDLRVAASPGMIEGLATDDVIVVDPGSQAGYQLIRRGRNICIHLFPGEARVSELRPALDAAIHEMHGVLDGTMGNVGLCSTVPVEAGFANIERVMNAIAGKDWYYSNVYDPITNEPLNWW
jgi:hypothetical protein